MSRGPEQVSAASLQAAATGAGALADSPADRRYLRGLYCDLLGRPPRQAEVQSAVGETRSSLVAALLRSRDFWQEAYERELFYFLLLDNFRPSTDAFEELPLRLEAGQATLHDVVRRLVSSQFFNARNPGPDTFVSVVLEQLLGITVQKKVRLLEAGKRMYDGSVARLFGESGSSQADLVRIALQQPEFEEVLVQRKFQEIFAAPLPTGRAREAAAELRAAPASFPQLVAGWVGSLAYEERQSRPRPMPDRVFVRALFVDLQDRVPDYQEQRRLRNALLALSDSRPLRAVIIKFALDGGAQLPARGSTSAEEYVEELFVRYLCRVPRREEGKTFASELTAGAPPRVLVRALLTHPDYQSY